MTDTPYDHERAQFSRSALARLALSDSAADLAHFAGNLAVTRFDAYTGPGGRAGEALSVTQLADQLLVAVVVYERERGSSWDDIARYLGLDRAAAQERFTPAIGRWNDAFAVPYRLDETGRKRIPQLPKAAYDPVSACRRLDLWAHLHLTTEDEHPVSASLGADPPTDERSDPRGHDINGWIRRQNLAAFMQLLAQYASSAFDETDQETVALGLESTDDENPDGWFTYPLTSHSHDLEVHLANTVGSAFLSVVVTGARYPELRLRIDTLMSALGAGGR